jgi:hypothetical protein
MLYVTPLLQRISQGIPNYTDHGIIHTNNVLRHVRDIVTEYPLTPTFYSEEKFILALSAVLHDIGCIVDRKAHNEITVRMLERQEFNFLENLLQAEHLRVLKQVIVAHSRKYNFAEIGPDSSKEIRSKLISALFRLADACDVSGNRIKKLVLNILVDEKKLTDPGSIDIWNAHLQVENVMIKGTTIIPKVYNFELADYCIKSLEDELKPINLALSDLKLPTFSLRPELVEKSILKQALNEEKTVDAASDPI